MLLFVAAILIAASLLVELLAHFVRENVEIEWPQATGRLAIERRARAARMREWTAIS